MPFEERGASAVVPKCQGSGISSISICKQCTVIRTAILVGLFSKVCPRALIVEEVSKIPVFVAQFVRLHSLPKEWCARQVEAQADQEARAVSIQHMIRCNT